MEQQKKLVKHGLIDEKILSRTDRPHKGVSLFDPDESLYSEVSSYYPIPSSKHTKNEGL
jgi:hypothetical protein